MLYNLFENRDFVSVFAVALLAEGVDRNEIGEGLETLGFVALLAEGVDRNIIESFWGRSPLASPSSRRAWIEIFCPADNINNIVVALLAEGVDRNYEAKEMTIEKVGRPPRGGRG